jgi:hypothetical protein
MTPETTGVTEVKTSPPVEVPDTDFETQMARTAEEDRRRAFAVMMAIDRVFSVINRPLGGDETVRVSER